MSVTGSVLYYSGYGHTEKVALALASGGKADTVIALPQTGLLTEDQWTALDRSDFIAFAAPTYMGSLAAPFKVFMDASSKRWGAAAWKDKIAGGLVNSGGLSGDKLLSMMQFVVFSQQHGMIWVGPGLMSAGKGDGDVNRLSSYTGVMTQSDNGPPSDTPPIGDLETASLYGVRLRLATERWVKGA